MIYCCCSAKSLSLLSQLIIRAGYEYMFRNGTAISHLIYKDDIKLYAKNEGDIELLIHLTQIYNKNTEMSLKLDRSKEKGGS